MTNKSDSEKYFEEYRQNKLKVKALNEEIKNMKSQVELLSKQREELNHEIYAMQLVITDMVDNGWDPVEAKLRRSGEVYRNNLWEEQFSSAHNGSSGTMISSVVTAPVSLGISPLSATVTTPSNNTSQSQKSRLSKIFGSII